MAKNQPPDHTSPTVGATFKTAARPAKLRIEVLEGLVAPSLDVELGGGTPVTFGRSRMADVVLRHDSISKLHFSLRVIEDGVELEDLGSRNGTWYAPLPEVYRRVRRFTLEPGDEFWAGACRMRLVEVGKIDVQVSESAELGPLFGESVAMRELFAVILKLAPSPIDLLITGETGTGKELVARTLHDASRRAAGPFVTLDCSTLAPTLADGIIFGFQRGAFTGAEKDQAGLFEQADGGTLFIDEIGELPPDMQVKFLSALDRRQVTRLGEPGVVRKINVRVVAATNRDLQAEVRKGRFREDLYHRLGHAALRLPPLRERGLDVLSLARQFLAELARDEDLAAPDLADDAKTLMVAYDWPGNVRELKAAIRQAAYLCDKGVIKSEDLNLGRAGGWAHELAKRVDNDDDHVREYDEMHLIVDSVFLPSVIDRYSTISASAAKLGITRERLRSRLKALGLYGDS
jgi:DNA-binding NtrC family response regulator